MNNRLGINYDPVDEPELTEGLVEIEIDLLEYLDLSDMTIKVPVTVEYNPKGPEFNHYFETSVITGGLIKKLVQQIMAFNGGVPDEIIKRKQEIEGKIEAAIRAEYGGE